MRAVAVVGLKLLAVVAIAVVVHLAVEPLHRDPRYRPLTRLDLLRLEESTLALQIRSREVWDLTRDVRFLEWQTNHPRPVAAGADDQEAYVKAFERADRSERGPRPAEGGADEEIQRRLRSIRQQIAEAEPGGS